MKATGKPDSRSRLKIGEGYISGYISIFLALISFGGVLCFLFPEIFTTPEETAFNIKSEKVHEIKRGHALIIRKDGFIAEKEVRKPLKRAACSFERIYFSRGNDKDIYNET